MKLCPQLASHFNQVHHGGNWSHANLKSVLSDIGWDVATKRISQCNTILDLTFHLDYYVAGGIKVLEGGPLDIHDKFSFDHTVENSEEWEAFKNELFINAEQYKTLLDNMEDDLLSQLYVDQKNGTYLRNILGLIEHHHYHLGQIVILKKIITSGAI